MASVMESSRLGGFSLSKIKLIFQPSSKNSRLALVIAFRQSKKWSIIRSAMRWAPQNQREQLALASASDFQLPWLFEKVSIYGFNFTIYL